MEYIKTFSRDELVDLLLEFDIPKYSESDISLVKKAIRGDILRNKTHLDIQKIIKETTGLHSNESQLLAKTYSAAYGRIQHLQKAYLGDVKWFEYVGIIKDDTYKFCLKHLNKHHEINEILSMKNGIIEPVIIFGGGFGCNHFWEADPFYEYEL